jgi:hypothetical protein
VGFSTSGAFFGESPGKAPWEGPNTRLIPNRIRPRPCKGWPLPRTRVHASFAIAHIWIVVLWGWGFGSYHFGKYSATPVALCRTFSISLGKLMGNSLGSSSSAYASKYRVREGPETLAQRASTSSEMLASKMFWDSSINQINVHAFFPAIASYP